MRNWNYRVNSMLCYSLGTHPTWRMCYALLWRKIRRRNIMNTCPWKLLLSILLLTIMPSQGRMRQKTCSNSAAENATVFVNSVLGNNSVICGGETRPCKSISYAMRQLVRQNTSTGLLNISAGFYEESEDLEVDCSRGNLKSITLLGTRQRKQVPTFDFSLDVQLCNICIFDIHWKGSRPLLFSVFMSKFSLYHCTIQEVNITIVGSSSQIHLQDSMVNYCKSYRQLLPLISVTSLGYESTLQIMNTSFLHNYGQLIFAADVLQTTIYSSLFENNKAIPGGKLIGAQFTQFSISDTKFLRNAETLLEMEGVGNLNASGCFLEGNKVFSGSAFVVRGKIQTVMKHCVFAGTKSSLPGPVMRINDEASSSLLSCQFSCNSVNESTSVPPIMPADPHSVLFYNCSVDAMCTVHCFPGEFLSDNILCQPCPVGTFSPGIVHNKTTSKCEKCPAGFYSSKTGTEVCAPCEANKFSTKPGATFCSKCTNDFFTSQPGQASCSTWTVGFIVLTVVVTLLIIIPLIILFYRSIHSSGKKTSIRLDEVTQCLCADERQSYSVQS